MKQISTDETSGKSEGTDWFHHLEIMFENMMKKMVKFRYIVMIGFMGSLAFQSTSLDLPIIYPLPADQTEIYIARFQPKRNEARSNKPIQSLLAKS